MSVCFFEILTTIRSHALTALVFLDFTTVSDNQSAAGGTTLGAHGFDLFDDVFPFDNFAKNDVATVQPGRFHGGDEELGAVGVWSRVCHGQVVWPGVLQFEVFVIKLV